MGTSLFLDLEDDGKTPAPARQLEGSYQIRNKKFAEADMVLRPRGASSRELTPIVLYPRTDWKCLTWKAEPEKDLARLTNHFTGKSFQPRSSPKEGQRSVPVVQVSKGSGASDQQRWRFVPAGAGAFRIVHVSSGWVLTAEPRDDEIGIVVAPWAGRDEQIWQFLDGPTHFSG